MNPEAQRIAMAEAVFEAIRLRESLSVYQHPQGTEGYRHIDLSGWWIYRRPDKTFLGSNWPSEDECRLGNIAELANRYDYLNDRNATWAAAEQLGEATIKAMRFGLFWLCGEMKAHHATAAQETEAILRHHGKWVEEKVEVSDGK